MTIIGITDNVIQFQCKSACLVSRTDEASVTKI